jgi:hypothetical protein
VKVERFIKVSQGLETAINHGQLYKEGNMVDGEREVMNTWAEYFTELLNKSNPEVTVTGNDERYDPQNRVQNLTPSVIYDIIKKLKKNKSPGEDVFRPNC